VPAVKSADIGFLNGHKKIILLGEAGSGKSEVAMNFAVLIRQYLMLQNINQEVRFLDMDQTKPLFRSRDSGDALRAQGITFRVQEQFMDAPVVPYGVIESITDPNLWTILDVGGGLAGALCIGQFADTILSEKTIAYYIINPYRPFSDTTKRISQTMEQILSSCHLVGIQILSNPYLGPNTTMEQLFRGNEVLAEILEKIGQTISLTAIPSHLWEDARNLVSGKTVRINPYLWKIISLSPSA
jgi:hypothetical protein